MAAFLLGVAASALIGGYSLHAQQALGLRGDLQDSEGTDGIDTGATGSTASNTDSLTATDGLDTGYQPFSTADSGGASSGSTSTEGSGPLAARSGVAAPDSSDNGNQQQLDTLDSPDQQTGAQTNSQETAKGKKATARKNAAGGAQNDDEVLANGTLRVGSIDATDQERNARAKAGNTREQAIENSKRPAFDSDPYAPLGLRVGTFNVQTSLQTGLEGTTNADSSTDGKAAILSQTTLRLNAQSDWARHSANINAYGIFSKSIAGQDLSQPIAGIASQLNLDISNDLRGKIKLGYAVAPETAESPVVIQGTAKEPLTQTLTGSLGLEKAVGKLRLGLTGNVERDVYGNAQLSTGGVLSQRDRDNTLVTGDLRVGYELSPSVIPFVEGELGRRYYDLRLDDAGYRRSANHVAARAGVMLDLTDKLSGEFSAGWVQEKPDDNRLSTISGPSVAADLKWSPMRGTTVSLQGTTQIEGSTTPGEAGDILYTSQLSLERQMRANLTGTATLGALWRDYSGTNGHDFGWNAQLEATYWLNRYFGLTGRVRHEQQVSNLQGRDYKAESVFLGVTLQQ